MKIKSQIDDNMLKFFMILMKIICKRIQKFFFDRFINYSQHYPKQMKLIVQADFTDFFQNHRNGFK